MYNWAIKCGKTKSYPEKERKKRIKYPPFHRGLGREFYFDKLLLKALEYHAKRLDLSVMDILAYINRMNIELFENRNGKIHHKNMYQMALNIDELIGNRIDDNFRNWINSHEFKSLKEDIIKIKDLKKRLEIGVFLSLSYLYQKEANLRYPKIKQYKDTIIDKVGFSIWSKPYIWLLANLLIFPVVATDSFAFDPHSFTVSIDLEKAWYEAFDLEGRKWYNRVYTGNEKIFFKIYDTIIEQLAGEIISTGISGFMYSGIIRSLTYLAQAFLNIYTYNPSLKIALTAFNIANWTASFLSKSFIPFLGFQIFVEWPIEGYWAIISQSFMRYLFDTKFRNLEVKAPTFLEKEHFKKALELLRESYERELTEAEKNLLQFLTENMSENQKKIFQTIEDSIKLSENIKSVYTFLDDNNMLFLAKYHVQGKRHFQYEDKEKNVKYYENFSKNKHGWIVNNYAEGIFKYSTIPEGRYEIGKKIWLMEVKTNDIEISSITENAIYYNEISYNNLLKPNIKRKCASIVKNVKRKKRIKLWQDSAVITSNNVSAKFLGREGMFNIYIQKGNCPFPTGVSFIESHMNITGKQTTFWIQKFYSESGIYYNLQIVENWIKYLSTTFHPTHDDLEIGYTDEMMFENIAICYITNENNELVGYVKIVNPFGEMVRHFEGLGYHILNTNNIYEVLNDENAELVNIEFPFFKPTEYKYFRFDFKKNDGKIVSIYAVPYYEAPESSYEVVRRISLPFKFQKKKTRKKAKIICYQLI